MLWDGSEEDGHVRCVCVCVEDEGTNCEHGDSDTNC